MRASLLRCVMIGFLLLQLIGGGVYARDASMSTVEVKSLVASIHDNRLLLSADLDLQLGSQLEEAALRGLPLSLTADVEIYKTRWYWLNQQVVNTSKTWRVTYNVLTRQWRVGSDTLALPQANLEAALDSLRRIRSWQLAEGDVIKSGKNYQGRIRVRLDSSGLTKMFQVGALGNNEWSYTSTWRPFEVEAYDVHPNMDSPVVGATP